VSQKEKDDWSNWNMEKELTNAIHRMKSERKFPRSQSSAGNLKGISLLLLHDPIQNFSCPSASSNGFMVNKLLFYYLCYLLLKKTIRISNTLSYARLYVTWDLLGK